VWYFTRITRSCAPCLADLRLEAKFGGIVAMGRAVVIFAPAWLDRSPVKSIRTAARSQDLPVLFLISFFVLGYLGTQAPTKRAN